MAAIRLRVFVSGDEKELANERSRVIIAIDNLGLEPVASEGLGAVAKSPEQWYKEEIPKCDIYVGVFGREYSDASCNEFLIASDNGKHRLVFVKDMSPSDRDPSLKSFIDEEIKKRTRYETFSGALGLQVKAQQSLQGLIFTYYHTAVRHSSGLSVLDHSIVRTVETRRIAFLKEIQLAFEDQFSHWETLYGLRKLVDRKLIRTHSEWNQRWYFPNHFEWADVMNEARDKATLVETYSNFDNTFERNGLAYDDYSEFLVQQAFVQSGFTVEARNTRRFKGREAIVRSDPTAGRPPDLDLIVSVKNRHAGVQVKNRLDYPEAKSIADFLSICKQLALYPVLIVRNAPKKVLLQVVDNGGRAIVFKRWLIRPPFPRQVFDELRGLDIPASVYQRVPDFLVGRMRELGTWLEQRPPQ